LLDCCTGLVHVGFKCAQSRAAMRSAYVNIRWFINEGANWGDADGVIRQPICFS
jgi:hypothetical protein